MKKCSLISKFYLTAAVLIAILFTGCNADTPENIPEDTIDGNSNNYCSVITFMDFESENWDTKPFPPEGDSAVIETVKGAGIGGSDCIKVTQNGPYGRTVINLKKYFNIHFSYYFEGWFKDAGTPASVNGGTTKANLSAIIWDKDIIDIAAANGTDDYFDYDEAWPNPSASGIYAKDQPSPWSAEVSTSLGGFEKELRPYLSKKEDGTPEDLKCSNVAISCNEWTKLNGVIHKSDLAAIYDANTKEDLMGFMVAYSCGDHSKQDGYTYYLDNLRVLALSDGPLLFGPFVQVPEPTLKYGTDNVIVINIHNGDNLDVYEKNKGIADYVTFTITGELPSGITFDDESGTFEGEIPDDFVEPGDAAGKTYTVTVTATNRSGTATVDVTIKIINAENAQ